MQLYSMMENGETKIYDERGREVSMDEIISAYSRGSMQTDMQFQSKNLYTPIPIPAVPPKMLFSEFIEEYLLMQKYHLRQNTYEIYKITADTHIIPYFRKLHLAVQEITTLHIQHYIHIKLDEGLSPSTLKKHYTIINGTLSYALYNLHMILYNPAERVKRPPIKQRVINWYHVNQIIILLKRVKGHPLEAVIILASHYGMRRSEVIALRWDAVDFANDTITIKRSKVRTNLSTIDEERNKTEDSYRTMPLMSDIKTYLQQLYVLQKNMRLKYKDKYIDNNLICKYENGEPFRPDYVTRGFATILKNSGLSKIRFHDLRHSAASILYNAGYDILLISYWLGHADVNTTKRYVHVEFKTKIEMSNYMNDEIGLASLYDLPDENGNVSAM